MNNLGEKIKNQRIKLGLTQQQFADQLYVSDKTISSWECGRTIPDINTLFKISNLLNINLYNLVETNYNNLENLEIEVKIKSTKEEQERVKNIIKEQNDAVICHLIDNYYIPTYRDFNYEWLRIRNDNNKYILTYKKKVINNCCEEYEVLIDNFNNFETILKNLNFKIKGTITKIREKIMYKGKYEFAFDTVDNIGDFIEIEVKKYEKNNEEEIKQLLELLKELNLDINAIENKRYFDYL